MKSTVVLDQAKKAYLSSFLFSQTDWSELVRVDSKLYPSELCAVYPPDGEFAWEDDVFSFGTLLVSVWKKSH